MQKNKTARSLTASVLIILALSICLCITTFALVLSMVSVEDNIFSTGTVKINLNDSKPIIEEHEFIFEPGMTVKKEFFIENESSCDVYYKLYFQNVEGGLADILQIKICDNDKILFEGTPRTLNLKNSQAADDILKLNERREFQIFFYFPTDAGNEAQGLNLSFDLAADAVQTKNNPNKNFD